MVRSEVSLQGSAMRGLLCLFFAFAALSAGAAQLRNLQVLGGPDGVRAVFDLDASATSNIFTLAHPDRLVVDLVGVRLKPSLKRVKFDAGVVKDVRYGHHAGALRVVFDLDRPVRSDHFNMPPGGGYGHRLIVDLNSQGAAAPATLTAAVNPRRQTAVAAAPAAVPAVRLRKKEIVVAIDPGHGGKDPGARGPDGLREKTVALAVAKKLAALIDRQPGMKAVLTRTGDYYVGLRERMVIARKADADLFISIHCNAVAHDPSVRGTEVYVLSPHGATSEQARWVANRENAADMVGGVDISDKSSQLASVLVDISQSATLDASFDLARRLMAAMGGINSLLHPVVQQAAFVVLKAPDIPSTLVETGFITNRNEERRLANPHYQEQIAHALLRGVRGYFTQYRPQQEVPTPTLRTAQRGALRPVSLRGDD